MTDTDGYVRVANVVRNGFVEGVHFGRVIGIDGDGNAPISMGDVDRPIHPRSTNKLLQAAGMLSLGLDVEGRQLALSAASHWAQAKHLDGVRQLLAEVGLNERALRCPSAWPEDEDAKRDAYASGSGPTPVMHGCSGKHAAMLRTCVINDWPVDSYLEPGHPLQRSLHQFVEETTGRCTAHTAVDGCGAPAWAMPLTTLANVYRDATTDADRSSPIARVADAMRAYPDFVCGDASEVTGLMRAVPGLLAKDGAESVYVAAVPDGRTVALKIADGGFRAGQAVLVAALRELGVQDLPGTDSASFDRWGELSVLGGGVPVGRVTPLFGVDARG